MNQSTIFNFQSNLNIFSWNIGTFHLEVDTWTKLNRICDCLDENQMDICFLQQTHINAPPSGWTHNLYTGTWSKHAHYSNLPEYISHQAGVAILFRKDKFSNVMNLPFFTTDNQVELSGLFDVHLKFAFHTCIIAIMLDELILVGLCEPGKENYKNDLGNVNLRKRLATFTNPFLKIFHENIAWKFDKVIVAGHFNDEEGLFQENVYNYSHAITTGFFQSMVFDRNQSGHFFLKSLSKNKHFDLENEFRRCLRVQDNNTFTVATWKIGESHLEHHVGIWSKLNDLCKFLNKQEIDICFLQETHLDPPENWNNKYYECFWSKHVFHKDWDENRCRDGRHKAGVAIFIRKQMIKKKELVCRELATLTKEQIGNDSLKQEFTFDTRIVAVELTTELNKLALVCVDGPTRRIFDENMENDAFNHFMTFLQEEITNKYENVIVAGDFNKDNENQSISQTLLDLGLKEAPIYHQFSINPSCQWSNYFSLDKNTKTNKSQRNDSLFYKNMNLDLATAAAKRIRVCHKINVAFNSQNYRMPAIPGICILEFPAFVHQSQAFQDNCFVKDDAFYVQHSLLTGTFLFKSQSENL